MPQMSPLWWEILYLMFIMLFIMVNCIIYWGINSDMAVSLPKTQELKIKTWKW
nr:ATPase subunit 8 [Artheneis intricata]